ncbi:MAG TPA: PAS domain S-box protein [Burkholderiales bacterium]|nr:PAS domain S-box protein [Burkholderiales bacterium]
MQVHRHVRTIYTVRVVSFIVCFLVVGLHAWERGLGLLAWIAAALHFLAYPHLAHLRSAHARDQRAAEVQNLYADAFMLGIWVGALHFPTWIAYPMVFAPALNGMVNRGMPGFALSLLGSTAGVVAGVLVAGYAYWPETSPLVTMLCVLGSLAYSAGVGYIVFRQARRMAATRESLRESEQRYRLITEHAGDLVAMVDRDGRWLYSSPSYARILRGEDLVNGADAFRNLHEDDQFRVRGAVQVVVRSGESCRLRMRLHTKDGEVRRFEALVHPVREQEEDKTSAILGANARITGAVIAARDVTELRDREEQLEVAAHAFERMAEAMMITNAAGRILMVNQSYARITGYSAADVVGRAENEYRTAMQPESFYDEIYAEVTRSGHWDGTTWCRRRDGTLYHEWRSVSAVRDAEERVTHYVTLFRELDSRGADVKSA